MKNKFLITIIVTSVVVTSLIEGLNTKAFTNKSNPEKSKVEEPKYIECSYTDLEHIKPIKDILVNVKPLPIEINNVDLNSSEFVYFKAKIGRVRVDMSNLLIKSNLTDIELQDILLQREVSKQLAEYAWMFIEAERQHGVNAIALVSIASLESDYGKSSRAKENNLFGYGVYSDTSKGINGDNIKDNIMTVARAISSNYLNLNGIYYGGGLGIDHVNLYYCKNKDGSTNYNWSKNINYIASQYIDCYLKTF